MLEERKKGIPPSTVNREVVEKLKALYRQKHPEEFPNLRKCLPPGYPIQPPPNMPLSQ
jgi:hypothetical protein